MSLPKVAWLHGPAFTCHHHLLPRAFDELAGKHLGDRGQ
jgi:hypothetical protein